MASPEKCEGTQSKSSVKCTNNQLRATIDYIFLEISTRSGYMVTPDNVKILAEALAKNQCFDDGFPKADNRLNFLENIKKKMTMTKESRATLITWLISLSKMYCKKFEEKETIEGVKVLSASKMSGTDEPNKSKAAEWFKEMGFKPLSNDGIPGMSSLLQSILKTCKHDHVDIGNVLEDDLEKRLEAGITKKLQSEIFDDCIPKTLYKNQEEFKKMFNLYLGLPLCVLHASENLKVNIRILCFPFKEEVYFYNQNSKKSGIVRINLGLIGHETYVPLIKITQDDHGIELSLKETIAQLKQKIKELNAKEARTEEEKRQLKNQLEILKQELEEKENQYKLKIEEITEKTRQKIIRATAEVAEQVADHVTRELVADFMNL
ncbi:uncharacterized protein LOC143070517 [Mytilus galloprovincialis]|uniref:uncharacterized protein LOC143070517 n=1 Tax=Mytilus galloprovincialis TaxID=29158 RepID=UPI003F7B7B32